MRYINPAGFHIGDGNFVKPAPPSGPAPGPSWVAVNSPSPGQFLSIAANATALYIGDDIGNLFFSNDGGLTWTFRSNNGADGNTKIVAGGGIIMMFGTGAGQLPQRSTNLGASWTPIDTLGMSLLTIGPSGLWTGWVQQSGIPNNHGFSADSGLTWTLLSAGGLPGQAAAATTTGFFSSGGQFVDASSDGNVIVSGNGQNWTDATTHGGISTVAEVNGVYIAGSDESILFGVSPAALQTAFPVAVPYPIDDAVVAIAGSAVKSIYAAGSSTAQIATAATPAGPWLIGNLNFIPGDTLNQILWDPLHQNFVAVGTGGSVSVLHVV